jgi:hypothetical protein
MYLGFRELMGFETAVILCLGTIIGEQSYISRKNEKNS